MKKNKNLILLLLLSVFSLTTYPSSKIDVLFIGDSQTEGFLGGLVYDYLKKSPYVQNTHVYGVGSSSPRHWQQKPSSKSMDWLLTRTARLNDGRYIMKDSVKNCPGQSVFTCLNKKHKPNLVVIQFLGNSMGMTRDYIIKNVKGLLSQLSDSQECIYISSPPYYMELSDKNIKRATTQDHFLEAIGSRCQVFKGVNDDTLKNFANQRTYFLGDKIHLSNEGAQEFFKKVQLILP